eukprot:TRINITY_DN79224_c0_g1_i1.p1 TRINITY_DN79224_c0_g1~~TRINITY_DN79224_c0_g1_i1.p1  ORF type:complete len:273 (+),score=67.17 TRINITY_DN79224_c0_g1_i1:25-819(+)
MAEPLRPWVKPDGKALLQGLKAKPELNGQAVKIDKRDPATGRWHCRVEPFGELIKVKPENLAEAPEDPNEGAAGVAAGGEWLRRGVHASVQGQEEYDGQIVRVLTVDSSSGQVKCVIRATGEAIEISRKNLRPVAGASHPTEAPAKQETETKAPEVSSAPRSDWKAAEMDRRRLAEGFRSGFEEGATVLLQGLQSCPELNGQHGKLLTWDSQALRWKVHIESVGIRALNPKNLVPMDPSKLNKKKKAAAGEGDEEPSEKRQKVE